jgi:hypothetical protein
VPRDEAAEQNGAVGETVSLVAARSNVTRDEAAYALRSFADREDRPLVEIASDVFALRRTVWVADDRARSVGT